MKTLIEILIAIVAIGILLALIFWRASVMSGLRWTFGTLLELVGATVALVKKRKEGDPRKSNKLINFVLIMPSIVGAAILVVLFIVGRLIELDWIIGLTSAFIVGYVLITQGLVKIPIQHAGVPLILGQRVRFIILWEGWNWIVPKLMDVVVVNLQERITRIGVGEGTGEKNKPLITVTIEGKDDDPQKRLIEMQARITLRWQVVGPYDFLNIGEESVENGLVDLAVKTLRQKSADYSDIALLRNQDEFEEAIIKGIEDEGVVTDSNGVKDNSNKATTRWGIKVLGVMIAKVVHRDPKVVQAYEKVTKEQQDAAAEAKRRNFLVESIGQLTDKGLSAQQAVLALQAESGKSKRVEIVLSGGSQEKTAGGDLTQAAAIIGGAKLLGTGAKNDEEEN